MRQTARRDGREASGDDVRLEFNWRKGRMKLVLSVRDHAIGEASAEI